MGTRLPGARQTHRNYPRIAPTRKPILAKEAPPQIEKQSIPQNETQLRSALQNRVEKPAMALKPRAQKTVPFYSNSCNAQDPDLSQRAPSLFRALAPLWPEATKKSAPVFDLARSPSLPPLELENNSLSCRGSCLGPSSQPRLSQLA